MALVKHNITIAVDFGTSRSGFAYILKGEDIMKHVKTFRNWEGATVPYDKCLTQILYDPNGKPISYGYKAPMEYSELIFSGYNTSEYSLFSGFKMHLQSSRNPKGILQNESSGREFDLIDVIADYLIYIKKVIEEVTKVNLTHDRDFVRWVFTVPAIWTDEEKQKTKEACVRAGIIEDIHAIEDDFLFAPEPEAAAAYCLSYLNHSSQLVQGSYFLVVDLGGGTGDLSSHFLAKEGDVWKLRSMTKGGGGPCGSTFLDKNFVQVMRELFGDSFMDMLQFEHPTNFQELMNSWEKTKVNISNIDMNHNMEVTPEVKKLFDQHKSTVQEHFKMGRIMLKSATLHKIFDNVLDEICTLIDAEISMLQQNFGSSTKVFDNIFVVGGFGESKVVQNMIISKYQHSGCMVVIPPSPGGAIVQGAVMLGEDPSLIITRRMKKSYGLAAFQKFENGVHDEKKKKRLPGLGDWYCKDVYDRFVEVNEEVRYDHYVVREYGVKDENQQTMVLELLMSPFPGIQYVTDKSVVKCGEVLIDLSGTTGIHRKVQVSMYFGKSAIEVRALDLASHQEIKAEVDFDRNKFSAPLTNVKSSGDNYHFVFVNDKSGSMGGNDTRPLSNRFVQNRLGTLFEACELFLSVRDENSDVVSCIMYDHVAHTCFTTQPISVQLVDQMARYLAGDGTSFTNAMIAVNQLISNTYNSYKQSHKIVVLFMSDGEDNASQAVQTTTDLVNNYGIVLHAIQLGGQSDNLGLKQLATAGRGKFFRAGDAYSLASIYDSIANHPVTH